MSCCFIAILLHRGIDPEEIDQSGMTALHYACELGRHENVEVLLQKAFKGMTLFFIWTPCSNQNFHASA